MLKKSLLATAALCLAIPGMAAPGTSALEALENAEITSGSRFEADDLPALQNVIDAQERHTDALMKKPGVHGTGVSWNEDGTLVLTVLMDLAASAAGIPENLDGVPVQVIQTGRVFALNVPCEDRGLKNCAPIEAEASAGEQPDHPSQWHPRPVPIGISAGHVDVSAGTIACRVSDGCHKYALSNAHVFADSNNGSVGDRILQPGPVDGGINPDDVIGTLYDSVPIEMSSTANNRVDAAIIATDARTVGTATRTPGYGAPRSATATAKLNMNVKKYGRTTWETYAPVKILNLAVEVGYPGGATARFTGQIAIQSPDPSNPFSKYGDSGALIVADGGVNDRKPVGLLFASTSDGVYTIANPINEVLAAFDVTIDGD